MKKKKPKFLAVRETEIFRKQIDDLVKKLGENQSRVIIRAIAETHQKYCGGVSAKE